MTNEEHDVITRFIQRVGGSSGGSVPSSQALPPVDRDADALIGELFRQNPEARYRITQLAYVQEQALNAAQQRMQAMQAQLDRVQSQSQGQQQGGSSPWGGAPGQPQHRGLLAGLFGGGGAAPPPPQQPQYQPPPSGAYQPQYAPPPAMMQSQGSGFLGGALRTAAGVAGGLVAGQALMNLFEGGHGGFGGGGFGGGLGGGGFGGSEVVNNETVINEPGSGAWGAGQADPMDQGGAPKDDQGGWQNAPDQSAGWQDAPDPAAGGGWQDAGQDSGNWDAGSNADDGGWTDSSSDA